MKIVLFGSGPFALPTLARLQRIHTEGRHELARVVTRPDRPRGRGREMSPTPVRAMAAGLEIPVDAPHSANDPEFLDSLRETRADVFIALDYGEMLRRDLRELPRIGIFNLHASLLPRHRGAAPVAAAILAGDRETGVTLFRIEKGLDSGPVVDSARLEIGPLETAGELEVRLASLAADLLERNLDRLASGAFRETPQDEALASQAPKLEKGAGAIDWARSPEEVTRRVLALNPWPGAFSFLESSGGKLERTVFLRTAPAGQPAGEGLRPGSVALVTAGSFQVRCEGGSVVVLELQREGKSPLDAASYLRGRPLRPGDRFVPSPGES